MRFEFHDDFAEHADHDHPDGWLIERHSAFPHGNAYVMHGAYALMLPGNKHIPQTPLLADFNLDITCHGDIYFNAATGLVIYFRYDPKTRRGYYLHCQWGAEGIAVAFGIHADGLYQPLQSRESAEVFGDTSHPQKIRLAVSGDQFELSCGDIALEPFQDADRTFAVGQIAFDHAAAAGAAPKFVSTLGKHLFLDSVHVASNQDFPTREVCAPIRVEFPPAVNGMQKPFIFEIAAREIGGCTILNVRLTGGSTNEPPGFPGGFYVCNEELTRPYVRLERADGVDLGPFYLVNGTVGLRVSRDKKNFMFFPADAECPVETAFRLAEWPENARLFVGYEFYQHEAAAHRRGGPTEAWVNPGNGRIRYVGPPLRSRCRIPEIQSPDDKEICRQLPQDDPRYEQALAFAKANHFFMEKEPCVFRANLRLRHSSLKLEEWATSARLEDAFREPMPGELSCAPKLSDDALSAELKRELGVETLTVEIQVRDALPVGVYHLVVQWSEGTLVAAEKRTAFEVMSADPHGLSAPLASGLPELHSWPDEAAGLTTNSFDPWIGATVDECHYVTGVYFHPEFARTQRVWTLLRFYRRQFKWQARYSCTKEDQDSALCGDMMAESDLINARPLGMKGRNDLWKRWDYTGDLLEVFRRFVKEQVLDESEQQVLTETESPEGALTPRAFQALMDRHWKPWLAFFCDYANGKYREIQQFVKALNPRARQLFGATYPAYASIHKGAYFLYCIGVDPEQIPAQPQGPGLLEDYPVLCRYSMQRAVYQLAAMKLVAPALNSIVEMYGWCATPVDGALLFGNPPYSRFDSPLPYFRKRLFEFAYAAVWFGKDGFAYWKDHGFHARFWNSEQYDILLSTWAIVRRAPPLKPLRSTAFASSLNLCRNHPDYYEPDKPGVYPWGDVFNTAEECIAYAYEQARGDGQLAGFLLDLESLDQLDAAETDALVLPPLTGASKDLLATIRAKHEQGVNLLGFEDVTGLEDLFGVAPLPEPVAIRRIRVNPDCSTEKPWREVAGLQEECNHPLCRTKYKRKAADALLEGLDPTGKSAGPVLVTNRTQWGQTALFCIPPTVVNRADQRQVPQYGQECLSQLMTRATTSALRLLGRPAAETTDGKLIAFRDAHGHVRVVVMEDAWPETPRTIEPRVTLHLQNVRREAITCDRPFSILDIRPDRVALRVRLEPHESAMISVSDCAEGDTA